MHVLRSNVNNYVTIPSRYAVRSTANPQATEKGRRPNSSCADDLQTSIYVVCSILKTVTKFSMNRHN